MWCGGGTRPSCHPTGPPSRWIPASPAIWAGLAIGPALFSGHDMGCDDIECYGAIGSTEALVAGAVVGGGVGYLLGSVLALVTNLDKGLLKAVQMNASPKGKPGLKVKALILI